MLFASYLRGLRTRCSAMSLTPAKRRPPRRVRLWLEPLEDRTLLSAFVVTTTQDLDANGNVVAQSLRDAIIHINQDQTNQYVGAHGIDEIDFQLPWNDPGRVYYQGSLGNVQPVPAGTSSDNDLQGTAAPQWRSGWWRIQPKAPLPDITKPVFIDGYSQSGAKFNTAANDDTAVLRIELNGRGPSPVAGDGLVIAGGNSTVRGLDINGFHNYSAILLQGAGGDRVQGNFIGTDVSGTIAPYGLPNFSTVLVSTSDLHTGVKVDEPFNNFSDFQHDTIGTDSRTDPADPPGWNDFAERNIISAASGGVAFYGPRWNPADLPGSTVSVGSPSQYSPATQINNVVAGNFIGTDAHGTTALGNWAGVGLLLGAHDELVGTDGDGVNDAGERNVISGNQFGVAPFGGRTLASYRCVVAGNWIGTDVNGAPLGNLWGGVAEAIGSQSDRIGGPSPGQGNTIAYNGTYSAGLQQDIASNGTPLSTAPGVWITSFLSTPLNITVQGDSIHDNAGLGIDLGGSYPPPAPNGVTANDSLGHTGPNSFQNFPLLASATSSAADTFVSGTLNSTPNRTFTLDFYANLVADPSGFGEGQSYLGSAVVTTDAGGSAAFAVDLGTGNLAGQRICATATDPAGNTSEFSADLQATAATGPIQGGQTAGIGFWNNKNGQALIKAFNGGTGTQLADWLAATLPHIFGVNAGSNNLTGKSNAYVAALFQQDFLLKGVKLEAQVLATALSVYATNATLDSTHVAAQYGFTVSGDGVGTATVNVGSNGDAFGVANNSVLTVMDLLLATDAQAVNGVLYGGDTAKRTEANNVFSAVNQAGNINGQG